MQHFGSVIRLSKYGMLKIMGIAVIGEGTTLHCVEGAIISGYQELSGS